jgi:hypothetical protein
VFTSLPYPIKEDDVIIDVQSSLATQWFVLLVKGGQEEDFGVHIPGLSHQRRGGCGRGDYSG